MKQSCPKCKTIIEINEKDYYPGSVVDKQCPLCDTKVSFAIPAKQSAEAADVAKLNEAMAAMQRQIDEMRARAEKSDHDSNSNESQRQLDTMRASNEELRARYAKENEELKAALRDAQRQMNVLQARNEKEKSELKSTLAAAEARAKQAEDSAQNSNSSLGGQQPRAVEPPKRKWWLWCVLGAVVVLLSSVLLFGNKDKNERDVRLENSKEFEPVVPDIKVKDAQGNETFTIGDVQFTMVYVEGGTFTMGCTGEQGGECYSYEKPSHSVTLSDYKIGETEVTQALWRVVMGTTIREQASKGTWSQDLRGEGDNYPMYYISYEDVETFIRKLNAMTGRRFRMPTEAEWEYAARGGRKSRGYKYAGSNTLGDVAWYDGNSGSAPHPVKTKVANELGLYDMSGNVWEWCSDWYDSYSSGSQSNPKGPGSGSYRVIRGGSWFSVAGHCRVSNRLRYTPSFRYNYLGFRLALQIEVEQSNLETPEQTKTKSEVGKTNPKGKEIPAKPTTKTKQKEEDASNAVAIHTESKMGFDIIAGFYLNKETAQEMCFALKRQGCDAYVIEKNGLFYVSMGSADSRTAAEKKYWHIKEWYTGDISIKKF
ncbi:MAG: SUMF1/EgtB/PvdO family nonheme iron enzyme [Bacteroidales bacterium]|nr:SUMF1/EgtB/PvdO family nonheme iron enzyme [Bacteroidales bacterium]